MAPMDPAAHSFRASDAARLRLASFRSQLQTASMLDPSALDEDPAEDGLMMAVANPAQNQVYAEAEDVDSDAEDYWSDGGDEPNGVDRGGSERRGGEEMRDAFTPESRGSRSMELDVEGPMDLEYPPVPRSPPELEAEDEDEDEEEDEFLPLNPRVSPVVPVTDPPRIEVATASPVLRVPSSPRLSTASEPAARRRSLGSFEVSPPGRLSADAAMEREATSSLLSSSTGSERETRRRSFDPRQSSRISGIFNFIRRDRSSERLPTAPSPPPPPLPPAPRRPRTHSPSNQSPRSHVSVDPPLPLPPPLPAPTLAELGLSLKPLTPLLTPSHMTGAPTSGCLLSPGYLLLCHSDGLDVVPLYAPPAARSYALIRGVPFKSVLVMDMLGFLVAVAGRREGVRVYALADIKRHIENRMEVEREKERVKRKSFVMDMVKDSGTDVRMPASGKLKRLASHAEQPAVSPARSTASKVPSSRSQPQTPSSAVSRPSPRPRLQTVTSSAVMPPRSHGLGMPRSNSRNVGRRPSQGAISVVGTGARRLSGTGRAVEEKTDWMDGGDTESDDDGYMMVPGTSAGLVMDSATGALSGDESPVTNSGYGARERGRRHRPADLQLPPNDCHPDAIAVSDGMPSPAPSMITMRQALAASPMSSGRTTPSITPTAHEVISFADALRESRLPDLPPPGTTWPRSASFTRDAVTGAMSVNGNAPLTSPIPRPTTLAPTLNVEASRSAVHLPPPPSAHGSNRRRRWSVLDGLFNTSPPVSPTLPTDPTPPPTSAPAPEPTSSRASGSLVPRIITTAFKSRNSSETKTKKTTTSVNHAQGQNHAPIKLEHIKLEGTRGAIMIKAVQTSRKSFLAILCGEDGKKVELFTGSARSASLSLARTFILPDSPLSLELQVQGEDLAELFLIFADSVFALEPASVRVRQVNIARAERRAARRRRERERGVNDPEEPDSAALPAAASPTRTSATAGASGAPARAGEPTPAYSPASAPPSAAPVESSPDASRDGQSRRRRRRSRPAEARPDVDEESRSHPQRPSRVADRPNPPTPAFTTFQQLSFSPTFPLGTLAEDWIIPPTYATFVEHKSWLQTREPIGDSDSGELSALLEVNEPHDLLHGIMNAWPRRGALRDGLLKDHSRAITIPLEDYFLPPISLLSQPAHYGPPCLFYCSRGGLSTTIVDHKGKSVLSDKFHWTAKDHASHRRVGLGDIQRVEAFDGINEGAVLVAIRRSGLEALDIADALLLPTIHSSGPAPAPISRRLNWSWEMGEPFPATAPLSMSSAVTGSKEPVTANGINGHGPHGLANGHGGGAASAPDYKSLAQQVFFLGREGSRLYICVRDAGSFRIVLLQSLHA